MAVLSALGLFGFLGLVSGALRQIPQWIGLILGYAAVHSLTDRFAPLAEAKIGCSPMLAHVFVSLALFYGVYATVSMLGHFILEKALGGREKGGWDRMGGFLLGAGKAGIAVYVLLAAVVFFEQPIGKVRPSFREETKDSQAISFVREHNLFAKLHIPAMEGARKMMEAAQDPRSASAFAENPAFKTLMEDPRLKAALRDEAATKALRSGNPSDMLKKFKESGQPKK